MHAFRVALCLFATATAPTLAQTSDIFDRLRTALGPSGQGELAVAELQQKDFAHLEQMLAAMNSPGRAQRAEIVSLEGAVAFIKRDMRAAVQKFDQAAGLAPLKENDSFTLAMALVTLGDDARARTLLKELNRKYPARSVYIYWLGKLDYDQRRYDSAVEQLTKATELDPKSYRAWEALALAFDMQGRMPQARDAFEKAVDLNRVQVHPSPWPPGNLGYLLLRMNQPEKAEAALRESLRYDNQLAQTHYHLARTLEKKGEDNAAVEEYEQAVAMDASSSDACYSLGLLYRKLHQDDKAVAMFAEYKKRKQTAAIAREPQTASTN